MYRVDVPNGSTLITPSGILKGPGKIHLKLRGVYFYYPGPMNETVVVRLIPKPEIGNLALYLGLGFIGGCGRCTRF